MQNPPKRRLRVTSPLIHGDDVRRLQVAINARDRTKNVTVDGRYGPDSSHAAITTARALGARETTLKEGATVGIQRIIRDPGSRTADQLQRAREREQERAKDGQGRAAMMKFAASKIGVKEHPPNSNGGPQIDGWQKAAGMGRGPWCGAFVKRVALAGGVIVTAEARYVPSLRAHARAGTGGYRDYVHNLTACKPGDHVCFEFSGDDTPDHTAVLKRTYMRGGQRRVVTIDGNSAPDGGNQANGGMVVERDRPAALVNGVARLRGV